ncbi:NmrA family NAD(P)-binding protein [Pseudarthrobacter sp. Y6]|uniref:NmrA family NAD(P)-binding protein n=1 Tax=Pseudarthrobacter sp. Y6 TaxID=3418422 RepID=UPI003CEBEADA
MRFPPERRRRWRLRVGARSPHVEMLISPLTPMTPNIEDGVVTWRVPLGKGAVPHVSLEDCGFYVRWLFDNQERANGMDLEVAIEHMTYADMAAAFEKVTGHPAQFIDTDLDTYLGWPTEGCC